MSGGEPVEAADVTALLAALADPVRLEMVRRLAVAGRPLACGELYDSVTKATASHHFRVLREAGLLERQQVGRSALYALRADAVERAYPGVLAAVVAAADAG